MRLWPIVPGSFAFAALVAVAGPARAESDELPAKDEAPRPVLTGVADVYYAFHDVPPPVRQSSTLTTASRHNEASVNLVALGVNLEHAKLTGSLVLHVGDSVDRVYGDHRLRYVQLANVGWRSGILHIQAGVLPSLVGRESFLTTENWSYTRAFIADATPYYVGGLRVTARLSPTLSFGLTGFNGWQTYRQGTAAPHGQLFVSWRPTDAFSLDGSFLTGPTQVDRSVIRLFTDVVAALRVHERVELALEGWVSREQGYDALDHHADGSSTLKHNPSSYGGALSARWRFGETMWLAGRAEALSDDSGAIIGNGDRQRVAPLATAPLGQRLVGGTITFGWQPHPKLIGRVEALQRYSTEPFFAGENATLKKNNTTFSVSAAVGF